MSNVIRVPKFVTTKRVLVGSPDLQDGVSWWRSWRPWCEVAETVPNVDLLQGDMMRGSVQWAEVEYASMVCFNRPFQDHHMTVIGAALEHGKPAIVDFDDLVWDIPKGNKASTMYGKREIGIATEACTRSSEITVSTPYLASYIQDKVAPDTPITCIPNSIPDWYQWNELPSEKVVLWRGGLSHIADIASVANDFQMVAAEHPDWKFMFIGCDPWPVTQRLDPKRYSVLGTVPLPVLHRLVRQRSFGVMIVPLEDCDFNRAKSNIAWMEGTLSGSRVVAPDFLPEFCKPGVVGYGQARSFADALRQAMDEPAAEHVKASRDYIDANLRAGHSTQQRIDLLCRWTGVTEA